MTLRRFPKCEIPASVFLKRNYCTTVTIPERFLESQPLKSRSKDALKGEIELQMHSLDTF